MVRRRHRGEFDEGAFAVLYTSVRHMIRDFKHLEEPFLDSEYMPDPEDRKGRYDLDKADPEDYYENNYCCTSVRQRYLWLRTKSNIISIEQRLSRLQTRRMSKQVADIAM